MKRFVGVLTGILALSGASHTHAQPQPCTGAMAGNVAQGMLFPSGVTVQQQRTYVAHGEFLPINASGAQCWEVTSINNTDFAISYGSLQASLSVLGASVTSSRAASYSVTVDRNRSGVYSGGGHTRPVIWFTMNVKNAKIDRLGFQLLIQGPTEPALRYLTAADGDQFLTRNDAAGNFVRYNTPVNLRDRNMNATPEGQKCLDLGSVLGEGSKPDTGKIETLIAYCHGNEWLLMPAK